MERGQCQGVYWSILNSTSTELPTTERVRYCCYHGYLVDQSIYRLAIVYTNTTASVKRILLKLLDQPVILVIYQ